MNDHAIDVDNKPVPQIDVGSAHCLILRKNNEAPSQFLLDSPLTEIQIFQTLLVTY